MINSKYYRNTSKIAIVQAYDEKYKELALLTTPNKYNYARLHNYTFIDREVVWRDTRNGAWIIPVTLLQLLEENHKEIDWFYWTDVDSLIMNYNIKLEEICDYVENEVDFIASLWTYESPVTYKNLKGDIEVLAISSLWYMMHTGNFFVRNSEFSRRFLYDICEDKRFLREDLKNARGWDEFAFTVKYLAEPDFRRHFKFLPNGTFISFDYSSDYAEYGKIANVTDYTTGDFIIHFPMRAPSLRIELIKKFLPNV